MMYVAINSIPIENVLSKLGVRWVRSYGTLHLCDQGEVTGGRRGSIEGNYISNFSGKDRATGPPFAFVKKYLQLSTTQTFRRFERHFTYELSRQ